MTDTELDLMIERDAERQWEGENMPAPANPIESLSDKRRIKSYAYLNTGIYLLGLALEDIDKSLNAVKGTPQGDKLAGFYDQLSDFIYDLKKVEEEIWVRRDRNA